MKLFNLTNNDLYYINHSKILTFKQKLLLFIHCIFNLNVLLDKKLEKDYIDLLHNLNSFLIVS
nr:MAG TPA_asm: hypothetical protein [Caudoviricetes sp.]